MSVRRGYRRVYCCCVATSVFFEHFYGALTKGATVGAAFDGAVLAVRHSPAVGDAIYAVERQYLRAEDNSDSMLVCRCDVRTAWMRCVGAMCLCERWGISMLTSL